MSLNAAKSDSVSADYALLNDGSQLAKEEEADRKEIVIRFTDDKQDKSKEDTNSETEPPVGFFSVFRYSSPCDRFLIVIGCITALGSGVLWPAILTVLGFFVDKFVDFAIAEKNITISGKNNETFSDKETFLEETAFLAMCNALFGTGMLLLNWIVVSLFNLTAANQAYKIRCKFMVSILKQDISWFDTNKTGDFASRITGDLGRIQDGIGEKAGICLNFASTAILCIGWGLFYGWKLGLVVLCLTPILTIAMAVMSKIQVAVVGDELQAYGAAGAVAEEVLSSIRTVVAFGGEKKETERYAKFLAPARKEGIKRGLMTSIGAGLTWFCIFAGYALAFWYGVKLIFEEKDEENPEYTAGVLIIVFSNIMTGSQFVGQLAPYVEAYNLARGAAGKVFSVIERQPDIDSSSERGEMPDLLDGGITIENVQFSYPARPDVSVLNGVSLDIKPGETIALVGHSGCGKSTIVQLILRFYDANEGCIKIDGRNLKTLNVGWLRNSIGFVGQEPTLFSTTIAENIRFGKSGATLSEIEEAAKLANAHDFISGLPLKYDTLVGERGAQLSGGQKQRIAVARALIKDPRILLLDEATSALDAESEAIVQATLEKARKGRTTVIVAHRLSTIRDADKIFVLSEGVIKEVGSHEELMKAKGAYYQLVLSQTQENEEEGAGDTLEDLSCSRSSVNSEMCISNEGLSNQFNVELPLKCVTDPSGAPYNFEENEDEINATPDRMRLFKLSLPEWPYIVMGALCSLLMGVHIPVYGIVYGSILGVLSEDQDKIYENNIFYCLIFLLLAVTSFASNFLQVFMFTIAGEKLTSRLREMVFTTIITQDLAFFDHPQNSVGSLCSKLTSDASDVQGIMGSRISTLLQSMSTFIVCVIIGLIYNYKIGLVVLSFAPLVMIVVYFEGRVTGGQILSDKDWTEKASKVAIEAIECIRTVASLHQETSFNKQFKLALSKPHKNSRKKSNIRGLTYAFAQSVPVFAFSTALYYGSILVASGELKYSDLFRVIEGVIIGTSTVAQSVAFAPDYQKAKVAAVRILKLLDLKPRIDALSEQGSILENVKGKISFQNVYFNYPSRPKGKVLRGIDLEIESGKTVALVGSSGCGKSTCVQLIERFYDVQEGKVALDDVDVKDMNVSNLRSHLGLVSQEPVLFSYSIAENIAYGDNFRSVDMEEIVSAAKKANIHNFITSLPQSYETHVGDKGTQLSGGQKQRVAIARALVRNPKILLLDEATSALDAESEKIVQEALDKARSGRTCLIIAHRLTTIQNADTIVVIHKGRIVEKGRHHDLIKLKGYYYKLHNRSPKSETPT